VTTDTRKMLIVGGGSAGIRHFRYLTRAGADCSVCDPMASCRVLKEVPEAKHYPDFADVDLSAFDGVVICTQPALHVPQALAAARAGCHVLIEKPISVHNEDGLDELQQLLKKKQLVGAVAFPYANMMAVDRIRDIIAAGDIGKVWSVAVHEGQNLLKYRPDYFDTYYASDKMGGGCLQDDAMHPMMGLEILFGPEQEVTAQRHTVGIRGRNVTSDDTAWLWLGYPDDVVATIDYSLQCHWEHNEWIIGGSTGAIKLHVVECKLELFDAKTEKTRLEQFDDDWNETFRRNDENFLAAIQGSEPVKCTIEMARTNLRAVLAARKSADLGETIRINEP